MGQAYVIAAVTAYIVTLIDLWSSTYPRTLRFLVFCPSAHFLAAVYAGVACLLLFLFDLLVAPGVQTEGEVGKALIGKFMAVLALHPALKGAFVGAFANGLANLKLFNIPGPNGPTPIGLQTLTLMFEPLKDGLVVEHHNRLRRFCSDWLKSRGMTGGDLPDLKARAISEVPDRYPPDRQAAIKFAFDETAHAIDLLQKGVERLGADWVMKTFA